MTKHARHSTVVKHNVSTPRLRARAARTVLTLAAQAAAKRLAGAGANLTQTAKNVRTKVAAGAKATDRAVRANPYKAIGVAAVAGAVVGALVKRRSRRA